MTIPEGATHIGSGTFYRLSYSSLWWECFSNGWWRESGNAPEWFAANLKPINPPIKEEINMCNCNPAKWCPCKKGHIHAALMSQYAEDAATNEKPWELWECEDGDEYAILTTHPLWSTKRRYRRKPRTININGHEVPEPVRNPPSSGCRYYYPNFNCFSSEFVECFGWDGHSFDKALLETGLIHLTKEAAELHAKALLSFTKQP